MFVTLLGDEGMTLLNSCQVIKSLACFEFMWQTTQLMWGSIEQVSSPACPSGGFGPLLGAKPKHPQVGALSQVASQSVDEIAPPSQIPGLNLTQFNNIGTFRPNMAQHIPKPSTRACRARNLFN